MKAVKITLIKVFCCLALLSCDALKPCNNLAKREAMFLIDISDPRLYLTIEDDLKQNLFGFMQRTKLGEISPCQEFQLSVAHLSGKDEFEIASQSISIRRKGQSRKMEQAQASPAPLVELLNRKLAEYRVLSEDPEMTTRSNIANTLFKALIQQTDVESERVILLFSDMMENNTLINFYKKIPSKEELPDAINKMIEPMILESFKNLQQQGIDRRIIIILKTEPSGRYHPREIKSFWSAFFTELQLEDQVLFIDNLSNNIAL